MDIQAIKQRFGIIGNSPGLNYAISRAMRVSSTNLAVLITGESGAGKEIFSKIIHSLGPRKHNPFIAVNCGAIPEGTIDSELFGHEKGAFTGAHDTRKGYFETVNGGTIFLDEIGEMPLGTQARLLRVLETGESLKVGSSKVQKTDVRVIAATNVDLPELIRKGKFREDLYYRLNTVPIHVPPLRERKEDIYLLFRKFSIDFAERYKAVPIQLDEGARQMLEDYAWPGNIRELKNIAEQISVLSKDKVVTAEELMNFIPNINRSNLPIKSGAANGEHGDFSERELLYKLLFEMKKDINDIKQFMLQLFHKEKEAGFNIPEEPFKAYPDTPAPPDEKMPIIIEQADEFRGETVDESLSIAEKERELIIKALKKHNNKRKDAASDLGISERTLYRKIKEYDIIE